MLYGARQVGKTYLLREFGEREFDDMVYINCYRNPQMTALFSGDADPARLLAGMQVCARKAIVPGRTFVFLDEVQEVPPVVSALKYFSENMPELHLAVAGSLLGVMSMQGESFPVGKVHILHLGPMNFEEFLEARGEGDLLAMLRQRDWPMLSVFHDRLQSELRLYYYIGGMPEAVAHYVAHGDSGAVRRIQDDILAAYEIDIAKHTAGETQRVRMVWQSIPAQLGRENKKFIYGAVRQGARAKDFELAIQWLVDAGLVHKVERVREVRMPLRFYADRSAFKLYLLDVGLLGALCGVSAQQALIGDGVFTEYRGALTENFVLQQLRSLPSVPIYYYSKDNSTQEVDFILQVSDRLLPVEVKAGSNARSRSFSTFLQQDYRDSGMRGVRLSMLPYRDQGWMENVPLYATASFLQP